MFVRRLRRRPRWEAVIIGQESRHVLPLPFLAFKTEDEALMWAVKMNAKDRKPLGLTVFGYRKAPT